MGVDWLARSAHRTTWHPAQKHALAKGHVLLPIARRSGRRGSVHRHRGKDYCCAQTDWSLTVRFLAGQLCADCADNRRRDDGFDRRGGPARPLRFRQRNSFRPRFPIAVLGCRCAAWTVLVGMVGSARHSRHPLSGPGRRGIEGAGQRHAGAVRGHSHRLLCPRHTHGPRLCGGGTTPRHGTPASRPGPGAKAVGSAAPTGHRDVPSNGRRSPTRSPRNRQNLTETPWSRLRPRGCVCAVILATASSVLGFGTATTEPIAGGPVPGSGKLARCLP
ncbi:Uncharacterised protein [Kocuria rosea]|nr:Uncharacterised protein [Kocuria rosea]